MTLQFWHSISLPFIKSSVHFTWYMSMTFYLLFSAPGIDCLVKCSQNVSLALRTTQRVLKPPARSKGRNEVVLVSKSIINRIFSNLKKK